ncbi:hypothetical protein IGB42_02539 [Andreprevotia sp. IGB-42]|uniref:hypothetical protein n=1 Tax=Andreprevotia sp. IGB-42 TaxID=2497473 RepID=UPI001359BF30|nr:hypothetical protein [Andreprevotia sp. IGB-42]KAF0813139.1 hypothetical protein IGB42_02539 [Andreprevotia sp. IGB-42]
MPAFAFWNLYRLGGGSGENKKIIIEGTLAQLFDSHNAECAFLCEVTGDVQLGDAAVGRQLYQATRRVGQLAYSAFNDDMSAHDLEKADIENFSDVFGVASLKKGGSVFSKHSKRPVAYAGQVGGVHVYIYHANASAKSAFLCAWVAESLNQDCAGNFILAGDLNCNPMEFATWIQHCCHAGGMATTAFQTSSGGPTHNAKGGLHSTYDWAIAGPAVGAVVVTPVDYGGVVNGMGFDDDPRSDHLPIVVRW